MALREIVVVDHPVLLKKAKKIRNVTPEIRQLVDDMIDTLRDANGVGLAAPQVGVSRRVLVVEYAQGEEQEPPDDEEPAPLDKKLYVLINPEITHRSEEMVEGAEGCLSIPGWMGLVERHEGISIKGLDRNGRKMKLRLDGWVARIFQHEIDHLDGILFTSRITDPEKLWRPEPPEEKSEEESHAMRPG